jgi:hypothetical protein
MRLVCKHNIWRIWVRIKDNQVVPSRNTTKMLPRRERRSGKERTRRQQPLHQCKDPNNHCNHCNINGHTKDKCWKLHPELNPKNHKKDAKKKNMLAMDSSNQVESSSDVDENIVYTTM